jgi:hypothetical protein
MNVMRTSWKCKLFTILVLLATTTSCASIETIDVWKDESSSHRLGKVLVLAVSEPDFMQKHFENVLSVRLSSWGIEAVPANKVFLQPGMKLEREAVLAKVREMGIGNVLVARAVSKEEASGLYQGGVYRNPAGLYTGWYGFYSRSFVPSSAYDAEFFTVVTNIYEVSSEKLIWSQPSHRSVDEAIGRKRNHLKAPTAALCVVL